MTNSQASSLQASSKEENFYHQKLSQKGAILAPMAGFTDAPFRKLCREFGSSWAVTEMVSAKGMVLGDLQGIEIGEPYPNEPDLVIQVFGGEPEIVAKGGRIVYDYYNPKAIDLNMGCPVKKVTGKSCGSKLMQDPERAADIIRTLNAAVPVPVSAKMRLGYDQFNVIEVAQALEDAGASVITVHGRTAKQKYTGEADWDAILEVAESVSIPVIGSGDVANKAQFDAYHKQGLGVMIARGAMGRPWVFAEILDDATETLQGVDIVKVAYRHAQLHVNWYSDGSEEGEFHAIRHLRSQLLKYFAFLDTGLNSDKDELKQMSSLKQLADFIEKHFGLSLHEQVCDELIRDRLRKRPTKPKKKNWKNRRKRKSSIQAVV